jgi:hypothetical protein
VTPCGTERLRRCLPTFQMKVLPPSSELKSNSWNLETELVHCFKTGVDKYGAPGRRGAWKFLPGAWIFKFISKKYIYPVLINKLDVLRSHFKICSFILVWFVVFIARICKEKNAGSWEKGAGSWITFSFVYPCFKTPVTDVYHTTRRHILKDRNLQSHRHENLTSRMKFRLQIDKP